MNTPNSSLNKETVSDGIVGELEPMPIVQNPPSIPGDPGQITTGTFTPPPPPPAVVASHPTSASRDIRNSVEKQYTVDVYQLDKIDASDNSGKQKFTPKLRKLAPSVVSATVATASVGGSYQFTATINQKFTSSAILVFLAVTDDKNIAFGTVIVTPAS